MSSFLSFFGYEVKPNTKGRHRTPEGCILHLSQVAISETAKKGEIIRFKVIVEDDQSETSETQEYVLATLIAGKHESQSLDISFGPEEVSLFLVEGSVPVHITGYYNLLDETEPTGQPGEEFVNLEDHEEMDELDGEDEEDDEEDDFDELPPEELALLREKIAQFEGAEMDGEDPEAYSWAPTQEGDESSVESDDDNQVIPKAKVEAATKKQASPAKVQKEEPDTSSNKRKRDDSGEQQKKKKKRKKNKKKKKSKKN